MMEQIRDAGLATAVLLRDYIQIRMAEDDTFEIVVRDTEISPMLNARLDQLFKDFPDVRVIAEPNGASEEHISIYDLVLVKKSAMKTIGAKAPQEPVREIQSLLLSKEKFTREEALAWQFDNGFKRKTNDPEEFNQFWRFRQRDPSDFVVNSFIVEDLPEEGAMAIYADIKEVNNAT